MNNLAIFCADIGSIKLNNFGWAASLPGENNLSGTSIEEFSECIAREISRNSKVAIGFECPLFIPVRSDPIRINGARAGEGNRSWSAGAGTAALATGLVEMLWVMNKLNSLLEIRPKSVFNWSEFMRTDSVFLWEAFVSSAAKGDGHIDDARIAISCFQASLPNIDESNAIQEENVLSLAGAASLKAGWSENIGVLSESCVVIKA